MTEFHAVSFQWRKNRLRFCKKIGIAMVSCRSRDLTRGSTLTTRLKVQYWKTVKCCNSSSCLQDIKHFMSSCLSYCIKIQMNSIISIMALSFMFQNFSKIQKFWVEFRWKLNVLLKKSSNVLGLANCYWCKPLVFNLIINSVCSQISYSFPFQFSDENSGVDTPQIFGGLF